MGMQCASSTSKDDGSLSTAKLWGHHRNLSAKTIVRIGVATDFVGDGQGTFDDAGYPDSLDVTLDDPFQWSSQRQETLLFQADLKGHTVRVYVASAAVEPTGTWLGKDQASGEPKSDK